MPDDILSNPLLYFGIAAIVIFIIYDKFIRRKNNSEIGDFKEQPLDVTLIDELKEKIEVYGNKLNNWKLIKDFIKIGSPDRAIITNVVIPEFHIDHKTKDIIVHDEGQHQTTMMLLRLKSNSFLKRLFGFGKIYFFFEVGEDYEGMVKVDVLNKSIYIKQNIDITRWGKIWVNSNAGIEYLSNISIKRFFEQDLMHSENMVDRAIHYDSIQAKTERLNRILAEQNKAKYEESKNIGDSTVI